MFNRLGSSDNMNIVLRMFRTNGVYFLIVLSHLRCSTWILWGSRFGTRGENDGPEVNSEQAPWSTWWEAVGRAACCPAPRPRSTRPTCCSPWRKWSCLLRDKLLLIVWGECYLIPMFIFLCYCKFCYFLTFGLRSLVHLYYYSHEHEQLHS